MNLNRVFFVTCWPDLLSLSLSLSLSLAAHKASFDVEHAVTDFSQRAQTRGLSQQGNATAWFGGNGMLCSFCHIQERSQ